MRRHHRIRANAAALEEPIVNLTPLIDVVFVVLIMFIVVAPLLDLEEIDLADATPQAEKEVNRLHQEYPIKIHVKHDNSIWYNDRLMTVDSLQALLMEAREKHPEESPLLFHDKRAQFGTYQAVKGAVERAGFTTMDLVLKPEG